MTSHKISLEDGNPTSAREGAIRQQALVTGAFSPREWDHLSGLLRAINDQEPDLEAAATRIDWFAGALTHVAQVTRSELAR